MQYVCVARLSAPGGGSTMAGWFVWPLRVTLGLAGVAHDAMTEWEIAVLVCQWGRGFREL